MEISGKGRIILILIAAALVFGGGFKLAQVKNKEQAVPSVTNSESREKHSEGQNEDVEVLDTEKKDIKVKEATIFVHVAGAVAKPGLFELPQDCRVNDALKKAEPLPEADLNSLNLAEKLADGQKVQVMVKGAVQDKGSAGAVRQGQIGTRTNTGSNASASGGRVNINTAGKEQLDTLPGIGPALAQRIIAYRQTNGFFKSVDEIGQVSGIGEKKFAEIKAYISK